MNRLFDPEPLRSPQDSGKPMRKPRRKLDHTIVSDGRWVLLAMTGQKPSIHLPASTPDHAAHFGSTATVCEKYGQVIYEPAKGSKIVPCERCKKRDQEAQSV